MGLETYKITEEDLKEYLIDLRNEVYNDTNITGIIKRAYEDVKTRIYELNHDVQEDNDIFLLLNNATKINGFKKAQVKVIVRACGLNESQDDTINEEVDAILRHECKLSKMNGWQK